MDVMQAIKERRSIRKMKTDPITPEDLNTVLEAARWAPSWGNTQAWRFVVVRDAGLRASLADVLMTARPDGANPATEAVRSAPVTIAACAERGISGYFRSGERKGSEATDKGDTWFMFDLALALQNLTLAAHALGLGTVHIGLFDSERVRGLLGVPPEVAVVELMPLGYPDQQPNVRPRKELNEFVCYDGWMGAAGQS